MRITAAAIILLALPATASAGCFDDLGRTGCTFMEPFPVAELQLLSCQSLWLVRNSIYDDHDYCFRTAAAQQVFDNTGCTVADTAQIRFNGHEQTNIDRIVRIERQKGC